MPALEGRTIVITGAMGGIGTAIAERCSQEGADVVGCGPRMKVAGSTEYELRQVDVTDLSALEGLAASIFAESRARVSLVNCAGVVDADTAAEDVTDAAWERVMAVNLTGAFRACRVFGRYMLDRGEGDIVNITSMSGNHVVNVPQRQIAYNVSKAAMGAMTKTLATEWGPRGVRVNSVAPGYISTPMTRARADLLSTWAALTPLGRMGEPKEVAAAVSFLLSEESGYFVGAELLMDGGYSLT